MISTYILNNVILTGLLKVSVVGKTLGVSFLMRTAIKALHRPPINALTWHPL